jgi:hypothetical protein
MADRSMSAAIAAAEFRVGQVFSRAFGIFSRHFVIFLLLTVIATSPKLLFLGQADPAAAVAWRAVGVLLSFLLSAFTQAVVLHAAFQDMRGRPVGLGESLQTGLARFLPVIGASIVAGFAVGLASLLLFVPGLMVFCMLYVTLPACVVERTGPLASLGRSSELTKGHRWKIFAIFLIFLLLGLVLAGVTGGITATFGGLTAVQLVIFVLEAVLTAAQAIVVVVAYHDLRVVKEGVDIEQIAAVFD